jgi:hypothetical protein
MQCDRLLFINLLLAYSVQGERLVLCNAIIFFSLTFFSLTTFLNVVSEKKVNEKMIALHRTSLSP